MATVKAALGAPRYAPPKGRARNPNEVVYDGRHREPIISDVTVAAIQQAFSRTRLSHQGWASRQLDGRLDSRAAWRYDAKGSVDIFRDRRLPSPTKLNVYIMVDASGSMMGHNACRAQDMVGTLVDAFKRIPTVKMHVYQHNAHSTCEIFRNYEPGQSLQGLNQMLGNIAGGNADGFALQWVGDRAFKQRRPDEQALVIFISDGSPSVQGHGAKKGMVLHTQHVAKTLRAKGIRVMSVAIAGGSGINAEMYGAANTVLFENDWAKLSRDFGAVFGTLLRKGA